ncbi:MAG: M20/M25/M40 family metallo-hydrolase [Spirochaetaceae bacterium]|nr:M20/M25/M40 family metallo-hydrolase [Spirochaetaceae bacterium]HPG24537.1 M20/M25/M40 family metallo-hydrolase [Myxococcota bacterium]
MMARDPFEPSEACPSRARSGAPDGPPTRRTSARVACLLGGVLLALGPDPAARAIWPFDADDTPATLEHRAAELLGEAIRTPTVNPPGGELSLARKLAAALGRAGIESRVIATPGPEGGPERAAVWGRLRGRRRSGEDAPRPALALLSHLDTVPADADEWSVDPFAGEIRDGYVWGRGALDAKGVAIAHLLTMIEIAHSDAKLDRDLVYLATPDEETGGLEGAGWIAANRPDLLEGVGYLLTEGGGIQIDSTSVEAPRPAVWGVTLTEKAPCWIELRARGRAGHSAAPTRDAAVPRLIAALDRIRRAEAPIRVSQEVARMFAALAPLAADWDRAGYANLQRALRKDEAFRRRFLDDPSQNALVRNTVSITVLEGAPKTNVAPAIARAQLDARLLPGESCEAFREELAEVIHDPKVELQTILSFPSRSSSSDTPLYRAIEAVAARHDPSALVVPRLIGGFTDAHWFRELGLVAYGFVPRALTPDEARRVHGVDERVDTATLARSIELMVEVVRSFDALETEEARKGSGRESGRTPSKDEGPSVRPGPSKYRKDAD